MSNEETKKKEAYLTETILSIHHDIQSAIDYIDNISSAEGTELGKGRAIIGIEKLRIKMPIAFEIEREKHGIKPAPVEIDRNTILKNLAERRGFLTDIGKPGGMGYYTKIKVLQPQEKKEAVISTSEEPKTEGEIMKQFGEIEITFVPMSRKGNI